MGLYNINHLSNFFKTIKLQLFILNKIFSAKEPETR